MTSAADQPGGQATERCAADGRLASRRLTTIDDLPDELIVKILAQSKVCGCGWAMVYACCNMSTVACCEPRYICALNDTHGGHACCRAYIFPCVSQRFRSVAAPLASAASALHSCVLSAFGADAELRMPPPR